MYLKKIASEDLLIILETVMVESACNSNRYMKPWENSGPVRDHSNQSENVFF